MKNKKIIIAALIIGALVVTGVFGAGIIIAQTSGNNFGFHSLFKGAKHNFTAKKGKNWKHKKFSQKNKLNYLDEAVKDGKITEQQKQAILAKKADMFNKMKELKGSGGSWEEIKKLKQDYMKWLEENDIDLADIYGKKGKWKKHGKFKKGSNFKGFHKNKPSGSSI